MKYKSLLLLLCLILVSCTGSNLVIDKKEVRNKAANIQRLVDIYAITPQLIEKLRKDSVFYQDYAKSANNEDLNYQLTSYEYLVGSGDLLNVIVWDHPNLTSPDTSGEKVGLRVEADGTIFYPYIGKLFVLGKSITSIREELTKRLSKYVQSPQVEVQVMQFNSQFAFVTGEVNKPGKQAITNIPLTALDALNLAGGVNDNADWDEAILIRKGVKQKFSLHAMLKYGNMAENRLLENSDVIYVPNNKDKKIFVMGEVEKQTALTMPSIHMTLAEALGSSGGINMSTSNASGVFVIRANNGVQEDSVVKQNTDRTATTSQEKKIATVYQLDLTDATNYILATSFELKPNDVVYVATAPIERWNRVIGKIMPTISNLYYVSQLGK